MTVPSEVLYTLIGVVLAGAVWTAHRLMRWWGEVKTVEANLRTFGHELYESSNATMAAIKAFTVDAEKMEKSAESITGAVVNTGKAQLVVAGAVAELQRAVARLSELIASSGGGKADVAETSEVDRYRLSLVNEAVNQGMSKEDAEVFAVEAMTHNLRGAGL